MGLMQREKGKRFERAIAAELRKRWPDAVVRRSSQAERAYQSDVFIDGGPPLLSRLWLELQDARSPTPMLKLEQAERDCGVQMIESLNGLRLPAVIWHEMGARESHVTMRLLTLDTIRWPTSSPLSIRGRFYEVVTMRLGSFLSLLEREHPNRCTCTYEVGSGGPTCTCWYGQKRAA
jgi:hypothetical protein